MSAEGSCPDQVTRRAANQRVRRRHDPGDTGCSAAPGSSTGIGGGAVMPTGTADDIIAVGKRSDKRADVVIDCTADQRVDCGNDTRNAGYSVAPGRCTARAVPRQTAYDIGSIVQGEEALNAHLIRRGAADQ